MHKYEYEHSTQWKGERELSGAFLYVLGLFFWIFIIAGYAWGLLREYPHWWFIATPWILFGAFWVLRLCKLLYGYLNYEPKITITLYYRKLNISFPAHLTENFDLLD